MRRLNRFICSSIWFGLALPGAWAAATLTFTADQTGTFPGSLHWSREERVLTVDLSGVPAAARIFRAELVLNQPGRSYEGRPLESTRVSPADAPEHPLAWVAPRFVSMDALATVQSAHRQGEPLRLNIQTSCAGVKRLEISCDQGLPKTRFLPIVRDLKVRHRSGQSLIIFKEPALDPWPIFRTGADVRSYERKLLQNHPGLAFRVWRSSQRITSASIGQAKLVGECGFLTGWNRGYHQGDTDRRPPLRYRTEDGADPVPWGTGIYAHNSDQAGTAYYAVTVAIEGEEDFTQLTDGNTTSVGILEMVGLGVPILQWKETPAEWHYRRAPPGSHLNRLIYTRWESWPNASRPNVPIDYLVATSAESLPDDVKDRVPTGAYRLDPAPVGLHLHCWGGSLNSGYGWWHNAHRGAVLIAANQVPYDWWTGYHAALGTAKTWGDGHVHPFTMNRMFSFLDWASTQWKEAPESIRQDWPRLDSNRVFTAGTSMGGSGAPMYAVRHGDRVAWALGWVGVHVPELSPNFNGSYENSYGPRSSTITMPDRSTSPWDFFSDVWFLRQHPTRETGFIIASNGKDDGGIGWPQAVRFARALQETRRPHLFNWGLEGHGTRTLIGANFDQDVRSDQSLPAFSNGSLDQDIGTGTRHSKQDMQAEKIRQEAQVEAGQRKRIKIDPFDGHPQGAYNAYLRWKSDDIVDEPGHWEITVILLDGAPQDHCTVDLTPRRLQKFRTPPGQRCRYTVTDLEAQRQLAQEMVQADHLGLLTLPQIPLVKGANRVRIVLEQF